MAGTFINGKEYTSDPMRVEDLEPNAYLVVATNTLGQHFGGSARFGYDKLGLAWGFSEGFCSRTYALPTLYWSKQVLDPKTGRPKSVSSIISTEETSAIFERFFKAVDDLENINPGSKVYMTKVGCGIAGRTIEEMKSHFWEFYNGQPNVVFPIEFEQDI